MASSLFLPASACQPQSYASTAPALPHFWLIVNSKANVCVSLAPEQARLAVIGGYVGRDEELGGLRRDGTKLLTCYEQHAIEVLEHLPGRGPSEDDRGAAAQVRRCSFPRGEFPPNLGALVRLVMGLAGLLVRRQSESS